MNVHTIKVRETADQIDAIVADQGAEALTLTITHVDGSSVRAIWAKQVELYDVLLSDGVVVMTRDGVAYLGDVDDVEDSTRGSRALITLS